MKKIILFVALSLMGTALQAKTYYVATTGSDANSGELATPFASLKKAQSLVVAGDTVYIRGGTYRIPQADAMNTNVSENTTYTHVFHMEKSGYSDARICYFGYPGERPVFDLTDVKVAGNRHTGLWVSASWLHFRNFEIVGTQVTISIQGTNTQSEHIRQTNGSSNIYENLAMHDGMAVGFYLTRGANTLVLNCDAYNNDDYYGYADGGSQQNGGNVDGFGMHPNNAAYTGNVFRGCRAWYNSDDGFDLINSFAAVTIENCWSYKNGYNKSGASRGNGAAFKSGGYGMSASPSVPATIPRHVIRYCLAAGNKAQGYYANHHLGGIDFVHNSAYQNASGFEMTNRKDATSASPTDVAGYGHHLLNNLSYSPRTSGRDIYNVNAAECTITNNSWSPNLPLTDAWFVSVNADEMISTPRKADGSLPNIGFMRPRRGTISVPMGYTYYDTVFSISYELNNGSNHPDNPSTYTISSPTIRLQAPTMLGFIFDSWREGDTIGAGSYGDKTFTAQWLAGFHKIYFESNGAIIDSTTVGRGDTIPRPDNPTWDSAHVFRRWLHYDTIFSFSSPVFEDMTIVAQWQLAYVVRFSGDSVSVPAQLVARNGRAVRPPDPIRSDSLQFLGWMNGDVEYDFNALVTDNIALVAKWRAIYTVRFVGEYINIPDQRVADGDKAVRPDDPTRDNEYLFVEWRNSAVAYDFDLPVTSDLTLEAVWAILESPCTTCALSVSTAKAMPLTVYPTLITQDITINDARLKVNDLIEIYSIGGELLKTFRAVGVSSTINLGFLPVGTYVIRVGGASAKVVKIVNSE